VIAIFAIWLVASLAGLAVLLATVLRPPSDREALIAIRRSGMAVVPSVLPLFEYGLRSICGLSSSLSYVQWPFLLGSLGGLIFMVASFVDSPVNQLDTKWTLVRLTHVVAWACGAVLAISMLLDV
jgi:hypothetical protein